MIAKLYYIQCDGCGAPCGAGDDLADSAAEARETARRRRWSRANRRDLCPGCLPTTPKESNDA